MHLDLLLVRAERKHDSILYYKVTGIIILLFLGVIEKTGPESPSFGFLLKKNHRFHPARYLSSDGGKTPTSYN